MWGVGVGRQVKLRLSGPVLVVAAVSTLPVTRAETSGQDGLLWLFALAVAASETIATIAGRQIARHWSRKELRGVLRLELVLTALLWVPLFGKKAGVERPELFFVVYAIVLAGELVVAVVAKKVVGRLTRSYYVKRLKIFGIELGELLDRATKAFNLPPLRFCRRFFLARAGASFYAYLLVLAVCTLCVANGVEAAIHYLHPQQVQTHSHGHPRKAADRRGSASSGTSSSRQSSARSITPQGNPPALTWTQVCGAQPGFDSADWARERAFQLLLGPGGPGAIVAGCTGRTLWVPGVDDFAYLIGRDFVGTVKSVVLLNGPSSPLPSTVVLAPAAATALSMIESDGAIGGSKRFDLQNGDVYLLYSASGTTMLIRQTKVRPGAPNFASPYVVVPPAVTEEFLADVSVRREWAWVAERPSDPSTGRSVFDIVTTSGQTIDSVEYDATSATAYVRNGHSLIAHPADRRIVTADQLLGAAHLR